MLDLPSEDDIIEDLPCSLIIIFEVGKLIQRQSAIQYDLVIDRKVVLDPFTQKIVGI